MEPITQLEQYIQQRLKKSENLHLIRILESRLNRINSLGDGNARTAKALAAARIIILNLSNHYGKNNE